MIRLRNILRKDVAKVPARMEKRLHNRAIHYWLGLERGGEFPLVSEFRPSELEGLSAHGFMLSLGEHEEPFLSYAGDVLLEEAQIPSASVRLGSIPHGSLIGQLSRGWQELARTGEPVRTEYGFTTEAGYRVCCRGVLLPLSSDGVTLDHVYGVVSWKSEKVEQDHAAEFPPV